jgi:succinyl-diaminopimelate desuccinylase
VTVNFRFAPDRSADDAIAFVREQFADVEATVEIIDLAPAARPGLDQPLAQDFVASLASPPQAKLGWTDVARFGELGVPALNFGPGDPELAHAREEHVIIERIGAAEQALSRFVGGTNG